MANETMKCTAGGIPCKNCLLENHCLALEDAKAFNMDTEKITLINKSELTLIDVMGNDHRIGLAAKVSTGLTIPEDFLKDNNKLRGLINYLMQYRHGTPFEHNAMTFFVKAPIFVWREWHRHRIGFSYNEESARYTVLKPEFYVPPVTRPMFKIEDWKPGRPKFTVPETPEELKKYNELVYNLTESYTTAYHMYTKNLEMGFDPGLARDCLPVGIFSSCWVTCNVRSALAFLSLRTYNEDALFLSYPLWEINQLADQMEEQLKLYFPLAHQAFVNNRRVAP